jgi:hypothetical protein
MMILILIVAALIPPLAASLVLANTSYPTFNYFEALNSISVQNAVLMAIRSRPQSSMESCRFEPPSNGQTQGTSTIGFVVWSEASAAGCINYNQAVRRALLDWGDLLVQNGYPPLKAMLFVSPWKQQNSPAGPWTDPYAALPPWGIDDGEPLLPTSILSNADGTRVQATLKSPVFPVSLIGEVGGWNAVWQSSIYFWYKWLLFALLVLVVAAAFIHAATQSSRNGLKMDRRTLVFSLALVSTAVYASTVLMRQASWTRVLLDAISNLFFILAFCVLLILWTESIALVHKKTRYLLPIQIVLYGYMLLTLAQFTVNVVVLLSPSSATLKQVEWIVRWIMAIALGCIASVFIVVAFLFAFKSEFKKGIIIGRESKDALIKLMVLCIVGALSFVVSGVCVLMQARVVIFTNPAYALGLAIVVQMNAAIRSLCLLSILLLKIPRFRVAAPLRGSASTGGSTTHALAAGPPAWMGAIHSPIAWKKRPTWDVGAVPPSPNMGRRASISGPLVTMRGRDSGDTVHTLVDVLEEAVEKE